MKEEQVRFSFVKRIINAESKNLRVLAHGEASVEVIQLEKFVEKRNVRNRPTAFQMKTFL